MALASVGGSVISKIAELIVEPVRRQFRYMFCFNNFVEEFKERKENLALALDGLQKDVEAAKRNAEEIKKGVEKWLVLAINNSSITEAVAAAASQHLQRLLHSRMGNKSATIIKKILQRLLHSRMATTIIKKILQRLLHSRMATNQRQISLHNYDDPVTIETIVTIETKTTIESQ